MRQGFHTLVGRAFFRMVEEGEVSFYNSTGHLLPTPGCPNPREAESAAAPLHDDQSPDAMRQKTALLTVDQADGSRISYRIIREPVGQ